MELTPLQKEGLKIVKLIQSQGFEAFWVGGTVRDMVLGKTSDNLDIATSAKPLTVIKILRKAKYYAKSGGEKFGTVLAATKHGPIEITTFRQEGKYLNRRKPESVSFIDDYLTDSKRRDFTINAIYYDPVERVTLDPHQGKNDIERKIVRFVGNPKERIDEDALRMLRAVRFSTQLQFKIEKNSFAAIKTRAKYIQQISGERIKAELDKILLSENREYGVRLLLDIGLLKFIMPEVAVLKNVFHKSKTYHLEGSVFEHAVMVLKNIKPGSTPLAYAALFHDTGKAVTARPKRKNGEVVNSFPNHEFASADLFEKFAQRLKFGRKERDLVLWITKMHMARIPFGKNMSEEKKVQLAKHKYFPELIELWRADQLGKLIQMDGNVQPANISSYEEGLKLLKNIHSKKKLFKNITDGDFIMKQTKLPAGRVIGTIKNQLENKIILGEIKNISDAKKFLKNFEKST